MSPTSISSFFLNLSTFWKHKIYIYILLPKRMASMTDVSILKVASFVYGYVWLIAQQQILAKNRIIAIHPNIMEDLVASEWVSE